MKALIFGSPSSFWVKELVQNVMLPLKFDVFLQESHNNDSLFNDFYKESKVTVIPYETIPQWIMKIPKIRGLVMTHRKIKMLQKHAPYDVIIDMFVGPGALSIAETIKEPHTKIYAYFCGSDIIRASKFTCLRLKSCLKKVDSVICASSNVREAYLQKIGNSIKVPYTTIRFGMSSFEFIDKRLLEGFETNFKSELNITLQKTTVCIGYNAHEAQNHLKVIEQLKFLPREILDKITVLLQMTYGGSDEYIANVEKAVSELGCDYRIFRKFLDMAEIAQLRLSTDVFINAQKSDGLSGSVLEALYAGATLLNASWLEYKEYGEWGISYINFSCYEDLPKLITEVLPHTKREKSKNREILRNQMSWKQCREDWENLIN